MKALIIGGGKVGFYLAKALLEDDNEVTLIERDKERCAAIANSLDAEVCFGDGTSARTMRQAGAEHADVVISVMGQDENNLVCCQMAKKRFNVRKVIAKVNNPRNAEVFTLLGIDKVISATDNIIQALEKETDFSPIKEAFHINSQATAMEITLPEDYALDGTMIAELKLPPSCNIACIDRGGDTIIPRGHTELHSGDIMLVITLGNQEKELKKILKLK